MKIKWSAIPYRLRFVILFYGAIAAVIAAVFAFSYFYDPLSIGMHAAKDGHQYSIGGVGHDCSSGRCNKFEIGYDCEGECTKEEMRHNAHDLMDLAQPRLNRRHYQEFLIRTSRAPHWRGQVDSEVIFNKQPDGNWLIKSEWYK